MAEFGEKGYKQGFINKRRTYGHKRRNKTGRLAKRPTERFTKGLEKGWQDGRQEVILNMLKKKADISFIAEVTGLSVKEIKKFKNGS